MRLFFFESLLLSNTMQQIICSQFDRGHKVNAFKSATMLPACFEFLIFGLPVLVPMVAFFEPACRQRQVAPLIVSFPSQRWFSSCSFLFLFAFCYTSLPC